MLSWFFVFFGGREMLWRPEVQGLEDAAAVTAVWLSTQRLHMPERASVLKTQNLNWK